MTESQKHEIYRLQVAHGAQWTALGIARCLDNVDCREIEQLQQPWVWRPDNLNPTTAPWERVTA